MYQISYMPYSLKFPDVHCTLFFYIKNRFGHFWELKKNINQLLISHFIIGDCSLMYQERFCKFSHTKNHIKGPCNFLKIKTLPRVRRASGQPNWVMLWIGTHKNIYIWSCAKCKFNNLKKMLNHSTLLYSVSSFKIVN